MLSNMSASAQTASQQYLNLNFLIFAIVFSRDLQICQQVCNRQIANRFSQSGLSVNRFTDHSSVKERPRKHVQTHDAEFNVGHADEGQSVRYRENINNSKSSQEKFDRLAIERGEDEGMRIFQNTFTRIYNSKES